MKIFEEWLDENTLSSSFIKEFESLHKSIYGINIPKAKTTKFKNNFVEKHYYSKDEDGYMNVNIEFIYDKTNPSIFGGYSIDFQKSSDKSKEDLHNIVYKKVIPLLKKYNFVFDINDFSMKYDGINGIAILRNDLK
jgi:hypothetical protein